MLTSKVVTLRSWRHQWSTTGPRESDFACELSCRDGLTFRAFHRGNHDDSLSLLLGLGAMNAKRAGRRIFSRAFRRPSISHYSVLPTSVHAAHPATAGHRRLLLFFWNIANERFSGEQQRRNRRRVLERRAHHLRRVDDARFHEILVRIGQRVEAFFLLQFAHF